MTSCPISVYIVAKNEADRIGRAIRSVVDWVDEVIVIDSGSGDETVHIASRTGARVLYHPWPGYGPQKRYAEDQCRNRWLLNLDADEEIRPELATEIQLKFRQLPDCAAYRMRVTDMLPGEKRPKWFAYSYRIMRLYNRQYGRCSDHAYKDRVEINHGEVEDLRSRIWHHSFRSWESTVAKLNFYTSQVATDRIHRSMSLLPVRLFTEFPLHFLKCYVGRRFLLRGAMGLAMSLTVAYLNLLRLLKTAELQSESEAASDGTHPANLREVA